MDAMNGSKKVRIAHLSGPAATIQNTPPLVTSNKARAKHGLPLLKDADGSGIAARRAAPQRLAAPAKVYVEQFSALADYQISDFQSAQPHRGLEIEAPPVRQCFLIERFS